MDLEGFYSVGAQLLGRRAADTAAPFDSNRREIVWLNQEGSGKLWKKSTKLATTRFISRALGRKPDNPT